MNIPDELKQVIQPTWNSCTSTCIAMITGKDVWEVINEFHDDYITGKISDIEYLKSLGYSCEEVSDGIYADSGVYLLSVPSLNVKTVTHSVVVDSRFTHGQWLKVFDPNNGKEGKNYYDDFAFMHYDDETPENVLKNIANEEPAYKLRGWTVNFRVE